MTGFDLRRQFQDRRSMADIVSAARTHPIIARLGLRTDLFDLATPTGRELITWGKP